MASFLSKIFGAFAGASPEKASAGPAAEPQHHADCLIHATPIKEGNQFRLAGRIERQVGDVLLTRNFIRADVFTSAEDALDATFRKARQIIDQNGPSLFSDGESSRSV